MSQAEAVIGVLKQGDYMQKVKLDFVLVGFDDLGE